jgi:hypothetical protein
MTSTFLVKVSDSDSDQSSDDEKESGNLNNDGPFNRKEEEEPEMSSTCYLSKKAVEIFKRKDIFSAAAALGTVATFYLIYQLSSWLVAS